MAGPPGEEHEAPRATIRGFVDREATRAVAPECGQLFGGNGDMEEHALGRLWRDALAFGSGAGTCEMMMRELVARARGLAPEREARP